MTQATTSNPAISQVVKNLLDQMHLRAGWDLDECQNQRYLLVDEGSVYVRWGRVEQDLLDAAKTQPVDRVQAMAMFVRHCESIPERHYSPDRYIIELYSNGRELCWPDANGGEPCVDSPCEHIEAVKMHLEWQK